MNAVISLFLKKKTGHNEMTLFYLPHQTRECKSVKVLKNYTL